MSHRARFLVVGGFLGAGKTTALLRLAQAFHGEGKRVGLITNDQASHLVDTGTLRVRGFRVEEVAGACFCCKFDELAQCAERIREEERPDVVMGEPVGSCTDLAATVVQPLRKLYGDRYSVAPYSVLVDPTRARQIVLERGFGGFSSKIAYIFLKQLEEADLIAVNKVDLLTRALREEILAALAKEFPKARVTAISALTGEGFAEWRSLLEQDRPAGRNIAEVDYDTYAEGEAELGWLNESLEVRAARPFDADAFVHELVTELAGSVAAQGSEVAHLKVLLDSENAAAVANFVGARSPVRLSQSLGSRVSSGRLVLNARAHIDPAALRALADRSVATVLSRHEATGRLEDASHFRPGRPVPTHRYTAPQV
jgi:G3E family GTPase